MKKYIFYILFITTITTNAQFRNYSNEFLNIGVDATSLGMSKAVVASSKDVNSIYWNPAGLVNIKDKQGSLMHASYFAGIATYNFGAFAMPIDDESAVAVSIIRFGVDDILNTTELIDSDGNINYDNISLFSSADYAFNFAYAHRLIFKELNFGINAKVIRRVIGDFASSWGFGFDAGIQFKKNKWDIGLMIRDITTSYNTWSINETEFAKIQDAIPDENQELPETTEITKPKVQFGIAKTFAFGRSFNLLTEFDLNMRFAETNDIISTSFASIEPALGFQLDYEDTAFLRLGVGNVQQTTEFDDSTSVSVQPNLGVGFKYKGIQIDYALTNIGSVGNAFYSIIFSIKLDYSFYRYMMLTKTLTLLLFLCISIGYSQKLKLSKYSEISIITSGPGEELYEKFGHTAIRVKDPILKLDLIYNYGIFDFDTPNFYVKFIRGFMNYKLARYNFYHSLKSNKREQRWVKEQILNFNSDEKNAFFYFLEHNVMPENANYFYDPYFDNCATRPRDIIKEVLKDKLSYADDKITNQKSLRQLMNNEIHTNTWGSFGINIALGNRLDKIATAEEAMYLPDYVFTILEASKINRNNKSVPLVKSSKTLLDYEEEEHKIDFFSPLLAFSILLLIGTFITYKDYKNKKRTRWFDFLIFFCTGTIGALIIFLWFFTNHSTAPNNFNFLWAFAPNVIVAFYITKQNPPKWILKYLFFLIILLAVTPIIWLTGIQLYSPYLILPLLLLLIRYVFLQKTLNSQIVTQ